MNHHSSRPRFTIIRCRVSLEPMLPQPLPADCLRRIVVRNEAGREFGFVVEFGIWHAAYATDKPFRFCYLFFLKTPNGIEPFKIETS